MSTKIDLKNALCRGALTGLAIAAFDRFVKPHVYSHDLMFDALIVLGTVAAGMALFAIIAFAANRLPPHARRTHHS